MEFHLAQINIGKIAGPIDGPVMAEFVANLDRINSLAENTPGFVWRLKDENNNATSINVFGDEFIIINMSVWENIDSLFRYVYQTPHAEYVRRRKEWFVKMPEMHMAMWYVPVDRLPTPEEAKERLFYLRKNGETPFAFGFKKRFTSEEAIQY